MRISGVNIPDDKKLNIALTYIYGIGPNISAKVLKSAGIDGDRRTKTLQSEEISKIQKAIEGNAKVEGELKQEVKQNVGRLIEIKAYRGTRHSRKLPVRGQRTRRNTRTVRGNVRRTVGSGKRKVELK